MRTILIAEDDEDVRRVVRLVLKSTEYELVEAGSGSEALELALHNGPDLLLLDWMMPVMTGIEVAEELGKLPGPMIPPIVMLADQYDALRSERPYRRAFTHDQARDVILRGDGRTDPRHFDPRLLEVFRDVGDRLIEVAREGYSGGPWDRSEESDP